MSVARAAGPTPSTSNAPAPGSAAPKGAGGGRLPGAVLWDLDGTLIDTEPYWIAAETELVSRFGGTWTEEDGHRLVGKALLDSAREILDRTPVDLTPLDVVHELQGGVIARLETAIPWRPGARELLGALRASGVPCALVTMSWRPLVDAVLRRLPPGAFAAVITGDAVERGKPDPEPYRAAAAALGVDLAECVAIEDSVPGVTSALAAGAATLVVPHAVPVAPRPGLARADTLVGLAPPDLGSLIGRP